VVLGKKAIGITGDFRAICRDEPRVSTDPSLRSAHCKARVCLRRQMSSPINLQLQRLRRIDGGQFPHRIIYTSLVGSNPCLSGESREIYETTPVTGRRSLFHSSNGWTDSGRKLTPWCNPALTTTLLDEGLSSLRDLYLKYICTKLLGKVAVRHLDFFETVLRST